MKNSLLFVGLDVHAQNITIALAHGSETGGRVLSAATRDVKSRTAYALRMAAQALHRSQSALSDFFRRMKARLGCAGSHHRHRT